MTRLASLFARLGPDPRADGTLLRTFLLDRDEAAFAELVRRHGPTVWGVCRRTLPVADAEDAFQATFLVLLRRRPSGDSLAPWLYRVAVLTSRGLRRKNARRRTVPLSDVPARSVPTVDVDGLLMRLPERERAAVVLCHLHGLTQRQAADRLGVPEGTLSARLSRGLAKLRGAAPVVLAVPAGVAEAAVTVATAGRAAGPGVSSLVTEVLRMFWLKKLATVGMAVVAVGGFGVGLGLTAGGPTAHAQTPPTPAKLAARPKAPPPQPSPDPEAKRVEVLLIHAGEEHPLPLAKSGRPVVKVVPKEPDQLKTGVGLNPNEPTRHWVMSTRPGVTWVTLRDDQGGEEEVMVAVSRPRLGVTTTFMEVVGKRIPLHVPKSRSGLDSGTVVAVRKLDGGQPDSVRIEQPAAGKFVMVYQSVGYVDLLITDENGVEWPLRARVIDPKDLER